MKEICKTCAHAQPTYKGIACDVQGKKVKTTGSCERWSAKMEADKTDGAS